MDKERNAHQIVRKDAKGCFVESLNDAFSIGKCHLTFATYDLNRPAGQRQTNLVQIYLDCGELCNCAGRQSRESFAGCFRSGSKRAILPRSISAWEAPRRKSSTGPENHGRMKKAFPGCSSWCLAARRIFSWWPTAGPGKQMKRA